MNVSCVWEVRLPFYIFAELSSERGEVVTIYTPAKTSTEAKSFDHIKLSCPTIIATMEDTIGCTYMYIATVVGLIRFMPIGRNRYARNVAPATTYRTPAHAHGVSSFSACPSASNVAKNTGESRIVENVNIHFIIVNDVYCLVIGLDVTKYVAAQIVVKSTIRFPRSDPLLPCVVPDAVRISQIAPAAPVRMPASLRPVILSPRYNAEMNSAENGVAVRITDASTGDV